MLSQRSLAYGKKVFRFAPLMSIMTSRHRNATPFEACQRLFMSSMDKRYGVKLVRRAKARCASYGVALTHCGNSSVRCSISRVAQAVWHNLVEPRGHHPAFLQRGRL